MTDNPDVERLNRIRAALNKEMSRDVYNIDPYDGIESWYKGLKRALEIVERVWEPFYEGKSEDRGGGGA